MATHTGNGGVVKIGSNTVAEVKSFSLSQTQDTIETSVMGSFDRTYESGMRTASGSVECFWDETDTNGQVAMREATEDGTKLTLNLYPEGADSGDTYITCSAILTEVGVSSTFDGMVERTFSFTVDGAVTWGTVS